MNEELLAWPHLPGLPWSLSVLVNSIACIGHRTMGVKRPGFLDKKKAVPTAGGCDDPCVLLSGALYR